MEYRRIDLILGLPIRSCAGLRAVSGKRGFAYRSIVVRRSGPHELSPRVRFTRVLLFRGCLSLFPARWEYFLGSEFPFGGFYDVANFSPSCKGWRCSSILGRLVARSNPAGDVSRAGFQTTFATWKGNTDRP
jgi:hypothetical protein